VALALFLEMLKISQKNKNKISKNQIFVKENEKSCDR